MNEVAVKMWCGEMGLPDGVEEVVSRLGRTRGVTRVAVMPDVHLAGEFCVGMAVASEGWVYPNAAGGDIGCGMLALRFDVEAEGLREERLAARVLGALYEACPSRRHHRRLAPGVPEELSRATMSDGRLEGLKRSEECRAQLGTLGAGNHFLELQRDDAGGGLWLMLHTGSRHLGQSVLHHYLPLAQRLESGVMGLEADSESGKTYLHDVGVARLWARMNRLLLARAAAEVVERVIGARAQWETLRDCDHNHVEREIHDGREVWVHRKGATAAGLGVGGIVPGSMGTHSFHTLGMGCQEGLCSSSHGAGRALSRRAARERVSVGALRTQMRGVWYDQRIERQLCEEAPASYKLVDRVMAAQQDLTRVERRLWPMLVYKGV